MKAFDQLKISDFEKHPVWQNVVNDRYSDFMVRSVKKIPVESLENRIVGTAVKLADGTIIWVILSNVSAVDKLQNTHFLTATIDCNGSWFDLARYHDSDFQRRNGDALAEKLGKSIEEVFPISFDLSLIVSGDMDVLRNEINYVV